MILIEINLSCGFGFYSHFGPSRWFIELIGLTALNKLIALIKLTGLNTFTGLNGYHPLILINHSTNQPPLHLTFGIFRIQEQLHNLFMLWRLEGDGLVGSFPIQDFL